MNLGNKITELRKKKSLSQEELAELLGVTRQTISKWELSVTTPDINQAKKLSNIFNISLDELTDNNVNDILVEKVSNTEKLAGITIKILKIIGISLLVLFIIDVIALTIFTITKINSKDNKVVGKYSLNCKIDNKEYKYDIEYNKNYQILNAGGDAYISNHTEVENIDDANRAIAQIEDYFKDHNGICKIDNS